MSIQEKTQTELSLCKNFDEAKKILVGNKDFAAENGGTWVDHGTWLFHAGHSLEILAIYNPDDAAWLNGELKVCAHDSEYR